MTNYWSLESWGGVRTQVSGNRSAASRVPFGSLASLRGNACRREFQLYLPGVWQSRKLGRAAWKPDVALTTPVLSLTSSAPSDPELSLNRTQIMSSTKAWNPGFRDARRPFLANSRGSEPQGLDLPGSSQVQSTLVSSGRKCNPSLASNQVERAQPTPGQQPNGWTNHSLPLVGSGVPGPRQSRVLHRLVPEDTVVVDAAHFSQANQGRQLQEAMGARGGAPTGE